MKSRKRNHRITLKEATSHVRRYRRKHPPKKPGDMGGRFDAAQVMKLLRQKGCTALRIYHGLNARGARSIILVGSDAENNDMTSGAILELCWPCPPYCSDDSELA